MSRSPLPDLFWVRYQPLRVLVSLQGTTYAAEMAHHRLCALVWSGQPSLPAHPPTICAFARIPPDEWDTAWQDLRRLGWSFRKNRLANPAVAGVLTEARRTVASYVARGRLGGKTTQAKRSSSSATPQPPPMLSPATPEPPAMLNTVTDTDTGTEQNSTLSGKKAERSTLSPSAHEKQSSGETDFMRTLQETLERHSPATAESELTNWGGWWRNRFRQDPAKAARVLAELGSMVKEGRIQKNPGAAATDLWKRLP